jgi:hypothetical protein
VKRATVAILFLAAIVPAWAAEPLVGTWRLDSQELNGQKANAEALVLKVTQSGDQFTFAFSVPVNNVYFVSMSYTVRLDGTEADVKNSQGEKVGTIKMTPAGASQYKLSLKGPNRPESTGKLTVSADGKSLTSESSTVGVARPAHVMQLFSRN